jgi:surface antigen
MSAEIPQGELQLFEEVSVVDRAQEFASNFGRKCGRLALASLVTLSVSTAVTATEAVLFPAAASAATPEDPGYISSLDGLTFGTGAETDNVLDGNEFDTYNCTSYVAYRLNADGVSFYDGYDGVDWGNAGHWITAASEADVTSSTTPEPGDVAVWADEGTGPLEYGHVAFVDSLNPSGSANFSEYNAEYYYPAYNPPGYDHSTSTLNPSGSAPTEYLNFGADTSSSAPPPPPSLESSPVVVSGSEESVFARGVDGDVYEEALAGVILRL